MYYPIQNVHTHRNYKKQVAPITIQHFTGFLCHEEHYSLKKDYYAISRQSRFLKA